MNMLPFGAQDIVKRLSVVIKKETAGNGNDQDN